MRILILDDDKSRLVKFKKKFFNHTTECVETAKAAINKLDAENYDYVFLDHDLGGQVYVPSGDNTGYEVAKWLAENPHKQPEVIVIHSFNPVGAENMKRVLPKALVIPGAWEKL